MGIAAILIILTAIIGAQTAAYGLFGRTGSRRLRIAWIAGCALGVVLPLSHLLDLRAGFGYDWYNHEWMIGYLGAYWRTHHAMPPVFNSVAAVGMPQPVFYSFLVYPFMGLAASRLGAAAALRLTVLAATAVQFASVLRAARRTIRHRGLSLLTAFASVASIYALTNLYNRAAITEYLAVSFLTAGLALGIAALAGGEAETEGVQGPGSGVQDAEAAPQEPEGAAPDAGNRAKPRPGNPLWAWLACVLFTLAAGCHPPTALLGFAFLGPVAAAVLWKRGANKRVLWAFAVGAVLIVLVSSPWLYAVAKLHSEIGISRRFGNLDMFPRRTDSLLGRLIPFPSASLWAPRTDDLPYVEAPIDGALLILIAWNLLVLVRRRSREDTARRDAAWSGPVAAVGIAWFIVMTFVSVTRMGADIARPIAPYVQFSYRLAAHANAGLLVAALATGAVAGARRLDRRHATGAAVAACLGGAIVLSGLVVKLGHASALEDVGEHPEYAIDGDRSALITAPRADAAADYAAIRKAPQMAPWTARRAYGLRFVPGARGASFGIVPPEIRTFHEPGWVITNVVAFPWNRVTVDGRPAARVLADGWRRAVWVSAGRHEFGWEWRADPPWTALNWISRTMFGASVVASLVLWCRFGGPRPFAGAAKSTRMAASQR